MEVAKIYVNGVTAVVAGLKKIPKGIAGATITVAFGNDWDGLTKTAVFQGAVTKDVLDIGNVITIPAECVEESGHRLRVGFYGVADETLVIPTLWADLGTIQDAADPSGDTSTDPTLPVWAQLQAQLAGITGGETATGVQINLNAHTSNTANPHGVTAEQAGAAPASHATDKNNPHGVTREQIQAAPSGYGLGLENGLYLNDCNDAVAFGLFMVGWQTANNPLNSYGALLVLPHNNTEKTQILTSSHTKTILVRHEEGGAWKPWEWENPTMVLGVEYRTTERWNGKPIYTKTVNCGALAHNHTDDVLHDTPNIEVVWVSGGYWFDGSTRFSIPYIGGHDDNHVFVSAYGNMIHRVHKGSVYNVADMTVVIKYTKSTD